MPTRIHFPPLWMAYFAIGLALALFHLVASAQSARLVAGFERPDQFIRLGTAPTWQLASVPSGWEGKGFDATNYQTFSRYNNRRARLAWYITNPYFYRSGFSMGAPAPEDRGLHYVRAVGPLELHPDRDLNAVNLPEQVFECVYDPRERGPYNFSTDRNPDGSLKHPAQNWGGMTCYLPPSADISWDRVQYLEFWLMDPFLPGASGAVLGQVYDPATRGREGRLVFDLGTFSEEVVWDSLASRDGRDAGFDNKTNPEERSYYRRFLDTLRTKLQPDAYARLEADPAGDDFVFCLDEERQNDTVSVMRRYRYVNNPEGNAPTGSPKWYGERMADLREDLNRDDELSPGQPYRSFGISLRADSLKTGQNYITEVRKGESGCLWYHFRIPLQEVRHPNFLGTTGKFSRPGEFRFLRMHLSGMSEPLALRMVDFQVVAPMWQPFRKETRSSARGWCGTHSTYTKWADVQMPSIETRRYRDLAAPPPPEDRTLGRLYTRTANDEVLVLRADSLGYQKTAAAYRSIPMEYQRGMCLHLKAHTEPEPGGELADGELELVVRLGPYDFDTYVEAVMPLVVSKPGEKKDGLFWPADNYLYLDLERLAWEAMNGPADQDWHLQWQTAGRYTTRASLHGPLTWPDIRGISIGVRLARHPGLPGWKPVTVWLDDISLVQTRAVEEKGFWEVRGR